MSDTHDGGPAFPVVDGTRHDGMTLRDYFAAHATDQDIETHMHYYRDGYNYTQTPELARYSFADAMLQAREVSDE